MIHESHKMKHYATAFVNHWGGDDSFERGFCQSCGGAYSDDRGEVDAVDAAILAEPCRGPPRLSKEDRDALAVLLGAPVGNPEVADRGQ